MAWIWTYRSGATPCVAASLSEALPLPPRVVVFTLGGAPRLRAGRARHPVALTPAILGLASSEQQHVALFQQRCRVEEHIRRVECAQAPLTRLRTFLDASAEALPALHVSAGRRGLEVELAPADLLRLTAGHYAAIGKSR